MMPFDTEKQTRTIDKYIGDIHREKRIDINKLNTDLSAAVLTKIVLYVCNHYIKIQQILWIVNTNFIENVSNNGW